MKLPTIVGVAGTNGSGKDTLGELLADERNFVTMSVSDFLRNELTQSGREHSRENLSGLSKQYREKSGDGAMAKIIIDEYQQPGRGLCITSIRTPGEVGVIQQAGGVVVWVDADERVRYERIQSSNRGRGVTDEISFEEFHGQQQAEMYPSTQGGGLNMAAVRDTADVSIINEFDSLEAYQTYLRDYFEFASN